MSQENENKADAAEARTQQTRGFMQQVRVVAMWKYTPEEKVHLQPVPILQRDDCKRTNYV